MKDHHLQATGEQGDQEVELQQKKGAKEEVDGEEVRVGEVMEEVEKVGEEEKREEEEKEEEKRKEKQEENQEEEQQREEEEQEARGQWKSLWSGGSLPTRIRFATLTLGSETFLCLETLCRTR